MPTLVSILQAPPEKIPSGLQAVAMDVLQTLVRSSPKPLPETLVTQAFAVAAQCTLQTDDNSTMQVRMIDFLLKLFKPPINYINLFHKYLLVVELLLYSNFIYRMEGS